MFRLKLCVACSVPKQFLWHERETEPLNKTREPRGSGQVLGHSLVRRAPRSEGKKSQLPDHASMRSELEITWKKTWDRPQQWPSDAQQDLLPGTGPLEDSFLQAAAAAGAFRFGLFQRMTSTTRRDPSHPSHPLSDQETHGSSERVKSSDRPVR